MFQIKNSVKVYAMLGETDLINCLVDLGGFTSAIATSQNLIYNLFCEREYSQ